MHQGCSGYVRIFLFSVAKQLEMRVENGVLVLESVCRTSWCRWHRFKTSKMLMQRMQIRKRMRLRKKIMRTRRTWRTRRIRMKTDKKSRRRRRSPISTSQRKLKRWQSRSRTEFLQTLPTSVIHDPTRFQGTQSRTKTQRDNFTAKSYIWQHWAFNGEIVDRIVCYWDLYDLLSIYILISIWAFTSLGSTMGRRSKVVQEKPQAEKQPAKRRKAFSCLRMCKDFGHWETLTLKFARIY